MHQGAPDVRHKKVLIALGGNALSHAGDPRATVQSALASLRENFGDITVSKLYQTPSFPKDSGPDFINAACSFRSSLGASDILNILHSIEADFGRERVKRWGQRTLDLDLIAINGAILPDIGGQTHWRTLPMDAQLTQSPDTLILPHPRVQDRAFVLVPMMDIAPDWCHPILGLTVQEMLVALPAADRAEIKAL